MANVVSFIGFEEVTAYLQRLPEEFFKASKKAIQKAVLGTHRQVTNNVKRGGSAITSRTGSLGRSLTPEVVGATMGSLRGSVYSDMIYAPIQEHGGVVTAKRAYMGVPGGPYLNIPTDANKTAAGVTRMPAREVFAAGGHVQKLRGARNYGVMLNGRLVFILRKSVTLKPRLGLRQAAEDQIPTLMSDLDELYQRALES